MVVGRRLQFVVTRVPHLRAAYDMGFLKCAIKEKKDKERSRFFSIIIT